MLHCFIRSMHDVRMGSKHRSRDLKAVLRSLGRILLLTVIVGGSLSLALRVVITQPSLRVRPYPEGARADSNALKRHVEFLTRDVAPRSYRKPENLNRAAAYIRDSFHSAGAEVIMQPYQIRGIEFRNVIARLGGKNGPRVIVGAHYDAFGEYPGTDDNASGTAGLLELAHVLAARNVETPVEIVAYSTEEPPFFSSEDMGSAIHASSLLRNGTEVKAMICLEMIGYFTERQPFPVYLLRLLYPRKGNFILVAGRWQDRRLIAEVKKSFRGASEVPITSYCGPTRIGTDFSDHRNYWANGMPAVMVGDTAFVRNPNYHKPSDTADTLDYDRMAEVVDGVASAVIALRDADLGD